jgi:hypothetical protein
MIEEDEEMIEAFIPDGDGGIDCAIIRNFDGEYYVGDAFLSENDKMCLLFDGVERLCYERITFWPVSAIKPLLSDEDKEFLGSIISRLPQAIH